MRKILLTTLVIGTFAFACSSSDESSAPSGIAGVKAHFDLGADPSSEEAFYDFPYPSDLRLDADGTPNVAGFPNPKKLQFVEQIRTVADDRPGYPVLPVAYFRFDAALPALSLDQVIPNAATSPILLVDVDETSTDKGALIPTVATVIQPDAYVPDNVLGVAARPGFILHPNRKYAFVVMRALGDETGKPLGVPETLVKLASGKVPSGPLGQEASTLYASLWDTLRSLSLDPVDVAAATVFTTGDVVEQLSKVSELVLGAYDLTLTDLHVDPDDGADHPRFCEVVGKVSYPQFQRGVAPFDTEGLFDIGADGLPKKQGDESAPFVLTIPRGPMPPGGYPLVLYLHGSGGLSTQAVDRGPWHEETDPTKCPEGTLEEWDGITGCNTAGEGPGYYLAARGFATATSALPVNPERLPGAGEQEYLNFNNLAAFRDTFRQGVIEQRLFLDALTKLEIPPEVVAACDGMSLPAGETAYRFSGDRLAAQGQSMGGMYTNMLGAVEPRLEAVVPTGAGGYWSYFILQTHLIEGVSGQVAVVLSVPTTKLTFMHPALHLFESAVEAADPIVYMPRLARRPLPNHPVRPIYEPIGKGDSYFPTAVYDSIVLAYGHPQAGDQVWPTMQDALSLESLDGFESYPVTNNLVSEAGLPYTGIAVQYEGDGVYDPHALYSQRDEVKYQIGCFLQSFQRDGVATVYAPGSLDSECP